jgi:uncharacterized protein
LRLCTFVHIIGSMNYEWDPNKARSNYKKHGIRFADAVGVFEDENAITIQDEHKSEDRFITIGRDFLSRILVVVYTFREVVIRVISARKATVRERKTYEERK